MGDVTVVVVPRERFSTSERALESLLAHAPRPFPLVYVDGNSPARTAGYLRRRAGEEAFTLVRSDRYLSPNQARNLGLAHAHTRYVVFLDNDCIVSPGWLDALAACAEETGAWVVGPLYFEGDPSREVVHVAGGSMEVVEDGARRLFRTVHTLQGTRLADVPEPLVRRECDFVEFHCMLVRRDVFDRLGPLDERLLSTREHLDLCLGVQSAGGSVWFEPASRVTYTTPPPLAWSDIPYFVRRWSEAWNSVSLHRFYDKWGFHKDFEVRLRTTAARRLVVLQPVRNVIRRLLGRRAARYLDRALLELERPINRMLVRLPD